MPRGRRREFDRQEVVERASKLFWDKGYATTGITELLEHLGIGRQSLYNTFGDKRSLYLESLRYYFDGRARLAREIFDQPGPRLEKLGALLNAIIEVDASCEHPGCLLGNTLAEFGSREPDIEETVGHFLDTFRGLIEELLEQAKKEGELAESISSQDVARSLLVMSQGVLLLNQSRQLRESGITEAVLRSAMTMLTPP